MSEAISKKPKFLKSFSVYDLLLIAMFCALTIAFKAVITSLIRVITVPIRIPGGALAGGLYMFWMPLAVGIIGKKGSAFLMTLIQCIVLFITGMPGSHGILTFVTYLPPALAVELILLFKGKKDFNALHFIISCAVANVIGTMGSNIVFFELYDPIFLTFLLFAAAFSGSVGGILGFMVYKGATKSGLIKKLSGEIKKENINFEKLNTPPNGGSPFEKLKNNE